MPTNKTFFFWGGGGVDKSIVNPGIAKKNILERDNVKKFPTGQPTFLQRIQSPNL
jgi:hypothetical protein